MRVISNGVDPIYKPEKEEKPADLEGKFCILTTGRLTKEKCQSDLLKAVKQSRYSDRIQVFIAGDGPLRNKLERMGKKLRNRPEIAFLPKEELAKRINYSDLYVHTSYAEIESIACVEAITCGLVPVIANSEMSAARYFALSEDDLYSSGNIGALAEKIDRMIENPRLRKDLRSRYIEFAEQFRIEKCIDRMEEMFEDAIAHRHPENARG